ncbi:MAG: Uma2 family endonuclease [Gemmataceae bacterium]
MPPTNVLLRLKYEKWAEEYLKSLPLEHFMEATAQSRQREITVESFALIRAKRPEFHYFNELLIQYPRKGRVVPGRVVPDNMVVLHHGEIKATGSYDLPFQPGGPFWTLEYVSKSNERKDYDTNLRIYERHLQVPFYMAFYPDLQDLSLFRLQAGKYVLVLPNASGRYPIDTIDVEVAILEGWVRYWYLGKLLPLPAELDRDLIAARAQLLKAQKRADDERKRAEDERKRADDEKKRADDFQRQNEEMARRIAELEARAAGNGKKKK